MPKIDNLYGLVLAGGRSRRMGRDKATLVYRGQLQVDRAVRLLRPNCQEVLVSVREEQENPTTDETPLVEDHFGEIGPLGGLLSAFYHHRKRDFLVLPCSMPFVDIPTIQELIAKRDPSKMASLCRNAAGEIEPLFAIYENAHKDVLLKAAKRGERELLKILQSNEVNIIDLENPAILDQITDQDDYYEAQKRIIGV